MTRLFVALTPPAAMADALLAIMGGIAGARWQRRDQLHLTLDFMGDVAPGKMGDLADHLAAIRHPPITVACNGIGQFERSGAAVAIWAGAGPAAALTTLADQVRRAVRSAGVTSQAMPFIPHITIARLNRASGPIAPYLLTHAGFTSTAETIGSFGLFTSQLGPDGSCYDLARSFDLTG